MSSTKSTPTKNIEFISRFVEACGTDEPARIQRLLNISYQTAKNYLHGRLPQADVLISIAERTSYSLDWLLTGRGKKFIEQDHPQDTPLPSGQMEAFVRRVCVEVINEMNGRQETSQPKVVVLQSSELMSEKVMDETTALTGRQP
jgi:predicted transcriptional regulator